MLEDLKNYNRIGTKIDFIVLIREIIGDKELTDSDIAIMSTNHTQSSCDVNAMLKFLRCTSIIEKIHNKWKIVKEKHEYIQDSKKMINHIVINLVNQLFEEHILDRNMFQFSWEKRAYIFKKEMLPLDCNQMRDVLVSCGFFQLEKELSISKFYVSQEYEKLLSQIISKYVKKFSLEQLKKKLDENEIAGEKAEQFVIKYEYNRLEYSVPLEIKQISVIDVSAGYDIASFENSNSNTYDRFIEVKAINSEGTFYWANTEIETAKRKENNYYLYLVDLQKIEDVDYHPEIIQNPAEEILISDNWLIEPQSFKIKKVFFHQEDM